MNLKVFIALFCGMFKIILQSLTISVLSILIIFVVDNPKYIFFKHMFTFVFRFLEIK